jgi:hypothetical protein
MRLGYVSSQISRFLYIYDFRSVFFFCIDGFITVCPRHENRLNNTSVVSKLKSSTHSLSNEENENSSKQFYEACFQTHVNNFLKDNKSCQRYCTR